LRWINDEKRIKSQRRLIHIYSFENKHNPRNVVKIYAKIIFEKLY
jgi:hypothetical protein